MRQIDELFKALSRSPFRRRFRLRGAELAYLHTRGMDEILKHARKFIDERLAPAQPADDGRQTPMRKHPVFVAQHATATCCRGCLEKWHGIPRGRPLTEEEIAHILTVLHRWLTTAPPSASAANAVNSAPPPPRGLFDG